MKYRKFGIKEGQIMELMKAIRGRHTYRGSFLEKEIDRNVLMKVLDAARWAPSGHNSQPWEFIVVSDKKKIDELTAAAAKLFVEFQKTRRDFKKQVQIWRRWLRWSEEELTTIGDGLYVRGMVQASWDETAKIDSEVEIRARFGKLFAGQRAPAPASSSHYLIFVLLNKSIRIPNVSQGMMHLTSIGAAVQNLRLAAHAAGLETHESAMFYDLPETRKKMMELLDIPSRCQIVGAMRIGYPGEPLMGVKTHVRKPVEDILHWNRY